MSKYELNLMYELIFETLTRMSRTEISEEAEEEGYIYWAQYPPIAITTIILAEFEKRINKKNKLCPKQ